MTKGQFSACQVMSSLIYRILCVCVCVDSFWKRWARDVFPTLIPRKRWHTEQRNVRVGDVAVLFDDSRAIRGKWTIYRVIEVYPGPDGRVRNVKVKTAESEYLRPVTKIAVICPAEGDDC